MTINKAGSQPSAAGPAEYFTGTVRIDATFAGGAPARIGGATVAFEPGARTAWHTHPLGQTLIVTSGLGFFDLELPLADVAGGYRAMNERRAIKVLLRV
jgi:quercetin dioxygenase-like cupin family protein